MMKHAANAKAWAIGISQRNGFHVRRVVWGLLAANFERRESEEIRAALIAVEGKPKRSRNILRSCDVAGKPAKTPTIDQVAKIKWAW